MNTRSSAYTGRHPRTLSEAFGPYEQGNLHTAPEPMHKHDRIVLAASALAAVVLLAVLIFN